MSDEREVEPGDLLDVAKDEDRSRSLHRALQRLSTGPDWKLREMANAVLRGNLTAQQAFTDPEYTAALFSGAAEVRRAGENRSAAESREADERFADWQQERRAEDERERAEQETPRHVTKSRSVPKHLAKPGRDSGLGGPRLEGPFRNG